MISKEFSWWIVSFVLLIVTVLLNIFVSLWLACFFALLLGISISNYLDYKKAGQ